VAKTSAARVSSVGGLDALADELVALDLDDAYARAVPRQDGRGDRARGPGPNNQNVKHWVIE